MFPVGKAHTKSRDVCAENLSSASLPQRTLQGSLWVVTASDTHENAQ
jgi:hypothetical protein